MRFREQNLLSVHSVSVWCAGIDDHGVQLIPEMDCAP